MKIKYLPLLPTVNLPSMEFIHILTAFHHLPISSVLFTHSLINACEFAQAGLNYTMNSLSKRNFLKTWLPEDFINKCFKTFMDNIHVVKGTTLAVEKKPLALVLPCFGSIPLQTRTKLKKSLKNILNCCKLQIVLKNKTRLGNNFHFKDQIPKDLTSGIVYKFQCGFCNESYYGECVRHFNVRIGEHICISPLTKKPVKPKNSSVADHLLFCNHSASYDDVSILTHDNKFFY